MKIKPTIFREYDIRGIAEEELTKEFAYNLGKACVQYIGGRRWIVGGDNRLSTEEFRVALIEGITDTGRDVINIGIVPTPLFYFALHHLGADGGVQITASHNPPQYNGFKVCKGKDALYGSYIQKIREIMEEGVYPKAKKKGNVEEFDIVPIYKEMIKERIKLSSSLKVVVDAGNGCAGAIVPSLLEELGCKVVPLYCELDGRFPHHFPDPTVIEYMQDLRELVKKEGADIGFGFDGDVDRLGVVDENGEIIWGDRIMVLFYREVLKKYPGAPCLIEVKCSQTLYDDVLQHGGVPQFYKTGHSLIKAKMKEIGAPFAGEMSGHMFFADEYFGFDDAIYAACRLLRILSKEGKSLSKLLEDLPQYPSTPEIRVDCPDEKKEKVVEEISSYFKQRYNCVDVDGVRVLFEDGWALVRKSNTSPKLILRFEAKTPEALNSIKSIIVEKLKEYPCIDLSSLL